MKLEPFGQRWPLFFDQLSPAHLRQCHRIHKLTLMAYHPESAKQLGRTVAELSTESWPGTKKEYETNYEQLVKNESPTVGRHVNVLDHMVGYLPDSVDSARKKEYLELIKRFREGERTLEEFLRALRPMFEEYPDPWIMKQTYWRDVGVRPPES